MMPFMAGQSMLMGDAFGKSYQYGKRKISAMSNEEFNKLTPTDLAQDITADFTALIPELKIAMAQSTEFQAQIIAAMTIPTSASNASSLMGLRKLLTYLGILEEHDTST